MRTKKNKIKIQKVQKNADPEIVTIFEEEIEDLRGQLKAERKVAVHAVMDLFFALKSINGRPTLRDLVRLAKRIRGSKEESNG